MMPPEPEKPRAPGHIERWVGQFLRMATYVAAALLFIGTLANIAGHAAWPGQRVPELAEIGLAIDRLGLLVLLAAPVLRVILAAALYRANRETTSAALSLLVLAIMTASYLLGALHR